MCDRQLARLAAVAAMVIAGVYAGPVAAARPSPHAARLADRSPVRCAANVVHPLSARVSALDPIARGAEVRLRVTASSRVGIEHAVVRMISTGGAVARGASVVNLGALAPGRDAASVFTVALPTSGNRFYVQFQVTGQGPHGTLSRGACYNLLPDGPLESGRLVVTPQGGRVMEVAARRIDR